MVLALIGLQWYQYAGLFYVGMISKRFSSELTCVHMLGLHPQNSNLSQNAFPQVSNSADRAFTLAVGGSNFIAVVCTVLGLYRTLIVWVCIRSNRLDLCSSTVIKLKLVLLNKTTGRSATELLTISM